MKWIGAHVSIAGGVFNAPLNARKIGATAFGMFSKNQRQWSAKPLTAEEIDRFAKNCRDSGYTADQILVHDSYLINLGHPRAEGLSKSRHAFLEEFTRCRQLGLKYLNFHPGSHLGEISENECLRRISESINIALDQVPGVTAVIENTAGQGSNLGFRFEHLACIIDGVEDKARAGVCLDTCHAHASGYSLATRDAYDETMGVFDKIVGLKYLKGMHLNDSKKGAASRVDRHAELGQGTLGIDPFRWLMQDARLECIPMILETPDDTRWLEEIRLLQRFAG